MSFSATVYRVLIASPSDTREFRETVKEALVEWNDLNSEGYQSVLIPVMWEISATPEFGRHPQSILNDQMVDKSDIVVGLFWTRLGTPTTEHESGSVDEIRRMATRGAEVLLYFCSQPVSPASIDTDQMQALDDFKESMKNEAYLGEFDGSQALLHNVQRDLSRVIEKLRGEEGGGDVGPTGTPRPSGPGGGETIEGGLERILDSYRNELRGLIERTRVLFEGAVRDSDSTYVRHIMGEVASGLSQFVGAIAELSPESSQSALGTELANLTRMASDLGRMQLYLDGGVSWNNLVEGSQECLTRASALASQNWTELLSQH